MKRQLSIQYENMINFINDKKKHLRLAQIITYFRFPPKQYADIFYKLYADKNDTDEMLDYAIPIITDIYNNNYELEEPKYYWKFKELTGSFGNSLYLSMRGYEDSKLDKNSVSLLTSPSYRIMKFTKSKVIEFLNNSTNLTIDNFTPMEEIEND